MSTQNSLESLVNRLEKIAERLESISPEAKMIPNNKSQNDSPAVLSYDSIVNGSLSKFLTLSQKLGGDIKCQVDLVKNGFAIQREFLSMVSQCKSPSASDLPPLLKKTADQIAAVQDFKEKHRTSAFINHLSALAESIPALGWVAVAPTPGPYIKEMTEAGQFYTNRVLKDFKEKDTTHVDWVKSWLEVLSQLQLYVKEHHTTGLQWNKQGLDVKMFRSKTSGGNGEAPLPPPPGPPPPPVPILTPGLQSHSSSEDTGRAELFSELNKGEDITKSLKKVSDNMKTHKNPDLRKNVGQPIKPAVGPKPGSKPTVAKTVTKNPPKLELDGKKWVVEYFQNNNNLVISDTEMKQTIYIYKCEKCTITIKGKVNAITMDSCKKTGLVFDESISGLDFINCQSVQAQVLTKVPTVNIDKTDGCMVYLSKDSLATQIVTAKSSEMNILVPNEQNEFVEFPIPEQFRTSWNGSKLVTEMTDIKVG